MNASSSVQVSWLEYPKIVRVKVTQGHSILLNNLSVKPKRLKFISVNFFGKNALYFTFLQSFRFIYIQCNLLQQFFVHVAERLSVRFKLLIDTAKVLEGFIEAEILVVRLSDFHVKSQRHRVKNTSLRLFTILLQTVE